MQTINQPLKTRELADELTQRARKQLWASSEFKKPRMVKINKAIDLLLGNTEKKLRQQFNIPLPVLSGMYEKLCFDKETEIFTRQGWKMISEVTMQDELLSMDIKTRKSLFVKPEAIIKKFHKGKMYKIFSKKVDLVITPDHRLFTYHCAEKTKKLNYKSIDTILKNLKGNSVFMLPVSFDWQGENKKYHTIVPISKKTVQDKEIKVPMDLWVKFLGWYIAEGSIYKIGNEHRITISQSKEANPVKYEEIKSILLLMPYNFVEMKDGFRVYNKSLYFDLLNTCYLDGSCDVCASNHCSHIKKVPDEIKQLSSDLIKSFLEDYRKGDGNKGKAHGFVTFYTSSKHLADDIQELIFKIGGVGTIRTRGKTGQIGGTSKRGKQIINRCDSYRVSFCEHDAAVMRSNVTEIDYDDFVYDVTVNPYHSIFVRRNKKAVWSGNCADLDDPVTIKFKEQSPKDYFAVKKINAAWKVESVSARTAARWAYKDRISRKQALIYGRGILKYFSEGNPYKSFLEATDFTYFHFQPTGGGVLENHMFCGEEGIMRTRTDIEEGVAQGIYDEENAKLMIERNSSSEYQQGVTLEEQDKYKRYKALGLDPQTNNYIGETVYQLVEWVMQAKGERWYILFDPWTKLWLRFEKLTDIYSTGYYPWTSYATHEDDKNFMSTAIVPDILWPLADSVVTLFNQEMTNRQKQNLNARAYDKDMFKNIEKLDEAQYRPDALVPADTMGGTRRVSEGIYAFNTPELKGTIDLIGWIEQAAQNDAAVVNQTPNAGNRKQNAIVYSEIQQLAKRIDYRSHSYTECWSDLGLRYIQGLKDNLSEPMAIDMLGSDGYMAKDWISKTDLKLSQDLSVIITSTKQQNQEDAMRKEQKNTALQAIQADPALSALLNPKWRLEKLLKDIGGYDEQEVFEAMDKDNFYTRDMMAKADIAIEKLLKGKEPEICYEATSAFAQKILDFAKSHRNNLKDKVELFTNYVQVHIPIITENMARMAVQSNQQNKMGGQDQSQMGGQQGQPPAQKVPPQERGQMAPRPGTVAAKPNVHP